MPHQGYFYYTILSANQKVKELQNPQNRPTHKLAQHRAKKHHQDKHHHYSTSSFQPFHSFTQLEGS